MDCLVKAGAAPVARMRVGAMNKLSKPSTNFTTVPNGLLRDEAISMKAKSLSRGNHREPHCAAL